MCRIDSTAGKKMPFKEGKRRPEKKQQESKSFGTILREIRVAEGIGVRELARKAKLHPTYVSKIELGQVPPPSTDKILRLSYSLGAARMGLLLAAKLTGERNEFLSLFKALLEILPHTIGSEPQTIDGVLVDLKGAVTLLEARRSGNVIENVAEKESASLRSRGD
jgi:transcriptional regulator with XRE-family HTH domain